MFYLEIYYEQVPNFGFSELRRNKDNINIQICECKFIRLSLFIGTDLSVIMDEKIMNHI